MAAMTSSDRLIGFTIPDRNCRGRAVRLDATLTDILSSHAYPPPVRDLLAEALAIAALVGGLLKDEGDQLTMQAQGEGGAASLLVCDYRHGELRGYIQHEAELVAALGPTPSLAAMFGKGHLAITFDVAKSGQRYQGIVPLEGPSLSAAVENYFAQSEQVPTRIRTAVACEGEQCTAGGFLVQHLPDGEDGRERLHARLDHPEWEHVSILAESLRDEELVDAGLTLEDLVWRLYHEEREVRVTEGDRLTKGCRCSVLHFEEVLSRFPKDERRAMANDAGIIVVDCAFCSKEFAIED